jgi:hypothetical protein
LLPTALFRLTTAAPCTRISYSPYEGFLHRHEVLVGHPFDSRH